MIKIVDCPTGCGAKVAARIGKGQESSQGICPKCHAKIWVSAQDNIAPMVFAQHLDPVAEAIIGQIIPHASQAEIAARDARIF